jgi:tetrahydromethanopterin S-methyltransferase subunit C
MVTQRDLVEANSFNRRRLVAAFLSGSTGGYDIEPIRPVRTLAAGFVLAVLLVAGSAVVRVLAPGLPDGWPSVQLAFGEAAQATGPGR